MVPVFEQYFTNQSRGETFQVNKGNSMPGAAQVAIGSNSSRVVIISSEKGGIKDPAHLYIFPRPYSSVVLIYKGEGH